MNESTRECNIRAVESSRSSTPSEIAGSQRGPYQRDQKGTWTGSGRGEIHVTSQLVKVATLLLRRMPLLSLETTRTR